MLFPTFSFAFFFLCVFIGFWYVFRRNLERRIFLVAASYLFYSFWDWRFCALLFFSTAANYGFGLLVGTNRDHMRRKGFLVLSIAFNLLLLGFFKYYNFFAESVNELIRLSFTQSGIATSPRFFFPALAIIMPVGISFYTFKAMSYVFDIYMCKIPAVRSLLDVTLYISFFPQIASGPIVQAADFLPQLGSVMDKGRDVEEKTIEFDRATTLVIAGLIKKMVFANFLSTLFVDPVLTNPSSYNTLEIILASFGYSVVMYCDFSGYSDMAIGVALLLGFSTPANFNRPYISFSVTEFWKRWHMTFSSWLRDYLYFSMGGSRFGKIRTLFALFFTMILGGLWHGAAITFIIWGAMQGVALAVERAFNVGNKKNSKTVLACVQISLTFLFVTASWIVFRAPSLESIGIYFESMKNVSVNITLLSPLVLTLLFLGLAMHGIPVRIQTSCFYAYKILPLPIKGVLIAIFCAFLSIVSMSAVAPFIYFQF